MLAVIISLALIAVEATPLADEIGYSLFVFPSVVIVWAVIGVWSAILYVRCMRWRHWKQGILHEITGTGLCSLGDAQGRVIDKAHDQSRALVVLALTPSFLRQRLEKSQHRRPLGLIQITLDLPCADPTKDEAADVGVWAEIDSAA
jgi:hypothetical protein